MHKFRVACAALSLGLLTLAPIQADDKFEGGDSFAKSTFSIQRSLPQFQSGSPIRESFFHNDRIDDAEDGHGGAFQVVVFGGQSNEEDDLARYFLPNCKSELIVANDAASGERDVDARHLNIRFPLQGEQEQAFKSKLTFYPEIDYVGAGLSWKQTLSRHEDGDPRWWFEAAAPIIHVETDMGLEEQVQEGRDLEPLDETGLNGDPVVNRAANFFAQNGLQYGRIDDGEHDDTQLAHIELKLGYNSVMSDWCYLNSFVGVVIPTSQEYNDEDHSSDNDRDFRQILQPITGTGGHAAIMYGSHIGFDLKECEQWMIRAAMDVHARYLFEDEEYRTFDLKGKPWSRYMEYYKNEDQAVEAFNAGSATIGTSGVNLLTQCVDVTPGYEGRVNTAFMFERCNFGLEVGFNVNYQQAEEIEFEDKFKGGFALKAPGGEGSLNQAATIANPFDGATIDPSDEADLREEFAGAQVKAEDLDLTSASHPATLHHTVYASMGYNFEHNCVPGFASIGGSYTFGATNNELDNWGVWGKIGISF